MSLPRLQRSVIFFWGGHLKISACGAFLFFFFVLIFLSFFFKPSPLQRGARRWFEVVWVKHNKRIKRLKYIKRLSSNTQHQALEGESSAFIIHRLSRPSPAMKRPCGRAAAPGGGAAAPGVAPKQLKWQRSTGGRRVLRRVRRPSARRLECHLKLKGRYSWRRRLACHL